MRISTPYQYSSYSSNIQRSQAEYFRVQQQLTTGKRFESGIEDPVAASLSVTARGLKARLEQFNKNLTSAKDYLGGSDNALSEIGDLTRSAYSLAVQGASSAVDAGSLQAIITQVTQLQDRLVSLANSQGSHGQYLFAGHKTDTKPFSASGGVLTFSGDSNAVTVEVRSSEYLTANVPGAPGLVADIYAELEELKSNLANGNVIQISDQSVGDLKALVSEVAYARGDIGARMQAVERYESDNLRRIDDFKAKISDLEDVDMAEAYVHYQQAQTTYQAALQTASAGMQLSLMDFIR